MNDDELTSPYMEGADAADFELPIDVCPYHPADPRHDEWLNGWYEARVANGIIID